VQWSIAVRNGRDTQETYEDRNFTRPRSQDVKMYHSIGWCESCNCQSCHQVERGCWLGFS